MTTKSKYHWVSISLALVFSLYTVGLPIVISACPMMMDKMMNNSACCADTPASGVSISKYKDASCCKMTIAAKPNTGEFVSSQLASNHSIVLELQSFIVSFQPVENTSHYISSIPSTSPPPRYVNDIPVFTSSLLI